MSLDLCLKQLHVVHLKVFFRMQYTRLLLFYSVIFQSCKFQSPTVLWAFHTIQSSTSIVFNLMRITGKQCTELVVSCSSIYWYDLNLCFIHLLADDHYWAFYLFFYYIHHPLRLSVCFALWQKPLAAIANVSRIFSSSWTFLHQSVQNISKLAYFLWKKHSK